MIGYDPYKLTAITRKKLSSPMKKLLDLGLLYDKDILDFGCGEGEDVEILRNEHKIEIEGYDKYNLNFNNENLLNKKYDLIVCNYVLNVIPELEVHNEVLNKIKKLSNEIYISIRSDTKAIRDNWKYIEEFKCYKTSRGSYQRFYDKETIIQLIGECEFIVDNNNFKLIKLISNKIKK